MSPPRKKWESPKSVLHVRRIAQEARRIKREKKDRRREERKLEIAKKAGAGARSVFWRPIAPIANNFVGGVFGMPARSPDADAECYPVEAHCRSRRKVIFSWRVSVLSRASSTN